MTEPAKKKANTPVPPRSGKKGGRPGPKPQAASGGAGRKPPGRRAAAEARRKRRNLFTWLSVVVVAAVIAVVVVLGVQSTNQKAAARTPIPAELTSTLTAVPVGTLAEAANRVSTNNLVGAATLSGQPLTTTVTVGGKKVTQPEILFVGAEFCPICATERWAMTVALSEFGSFTNLQQTRSAVRDGDIATLSFYGSTYTSPDFVFSHYETTTNQPKGNSYVPLQTPPASVQSIWQNTLAQFNQGPSFPFLDIGGKYLIYTAQYSQSDLSGMNFNQIAGDVGNNNSKVGAEIDASAAELVHYICGVTGEKPANVCSAVANIPLAAPPTTGASTSPAGT